MLCFFSSLICVSSSRCCCVRRRFFSHSVRCFFFFYSTLNASSMVYASAQINPHIYSIPYICVCGSANIYTQIVRERERKRYVLHTTESIFLLLSGVVAVSLCVIFVLTLRYVGSVWNANSNRIGSYVIMTLSEFWYWRVLMHTTHTYTEINSFVCSSFLVSSHTLHNKWMVDQDLLECACVYVINVVVLVTTQYYQQNMYNSMISMMSVDVFVFVLYILIRRRRRFSSFFFVLFVCLSLFWMFFFCLSLVVMHNWNQTQSIQSHSENKLFFSKQNNKMSIRVDFFFVHNFFSFLSTRFCTRFSRWILISVRF